MVVVAGYAFDRRHRHRHMCHGQFGCPFGWISPNYEGYGCEIAGGGAVCVVPYHGGGVVSGVSSGHVAAFAGLPFVCPALPYFSHFSP